MSFNKKTIRDVDWQGKTALVRVDYNVSIKDGKVVDELRLRESLPTLEYLREHGVKRMVLMSHLGRPAGQANPAFSLKPTAERLAELMPGHVVAFVDWATGNVANAVEKLPEGGILMLENLRFAPEEEANSTEFAQKIVSETGADVFVQDGFAVLHRKHASTDAMARLLPAVAGLLVEKEAKALDAVMENPERPLMFIVGGAKVEDKKPLVERFLPIADKIAVGGKIAVDGLNVSDPKIYVAEGFVSNAEGEKLDIDEASTAHIIDMMRDAKTIIWNGTMGMAETAEFSTGSRKIAEAMGHLSGANTVIGGGDTAGFVESLMKEDPSLSYTMILTGGGAGLKYLLDENLPGLEVLQNS